MIIGLPKWNCAFLELYEKQAAEIAKMGRPTRLALNNHSIPTLLFPTQRYPTMKLGKA